MELIQRPIFLSAIALAAVLAPAVSSAQATNVQVYGIVDMYLGRSATSGTPGVHVANSGGMTTSFWGLGGTESLGGGRSMTFAVEGFMRADTGEGGRTAGEAMFSRAAYVGMNDSWGSVKFGRIPSPLFQATGALNPFGFSTRFAPLMTQMWIAPYGSAVAGDSGWSNAIHYTSPTVGGFNLVGQVGLGETPGNSSNNNAIVVLKYTGAALSYALAAQEIKNGLNVTAAAPSQRTRFAGASYDLKAVKLYASYDRNKTELSGRDTRMLHAGAAIPHGAGRWMLGWARAKERTAVRAPFRRDTASAGYDYNLSLRTDLYAVAVYDKLGTAGSGNTVATGIRHRF
ncbi:porin [Pseudoduganella namucuonensis]|uniref:Outer membrane protein (Porin) n=1 Tax=Pseudoduganella namucuonensis TaxID=1035707 RepID=A0A1I7LF99_9BURK|nr:porin [Pseudoduganella namucuonensis]SFV08345.1 Outer membrane protein (porin) [Pseudoduganella namucuonensis]